MREAIERLESATHALIDATSPLMDDDVCEDPKFLTFVHTTNIFADAVLGLLKALNEEDHYAIS